MVSVPGIWFAWVRNFCGSMFCNLNDRTCRSSVATENSKLESFVKITFISACSTNTWGRLPHSAIKPPELTSRSQWTCYLQQHAVTPKGACTIYCNRQSTEGMVGLGPCHTFYQLGLAPVALKRWSGLVIYLSIRTRPYKGNGRIEGSSSGIWLERLVCLLCKFDCCTI